MYVDDVELTNLRCFEHARLHVASDGVTAICGPNATGKTTLLEAVYLVAERRSFRPGELCGIVRREAAQANVHARAGIQGRSVELATAVRANGGTSQQWNGKRVPAGVRGPLAVSAFTPDDMELVKGPPDVRRRWLDGAVSATSAQMARVRHDAERILRQRNRLLQQAAGSPSASVMSSLDVWDEQFARVGELLRAHRAEVARELGPYVQETFAHLVAVNREVTCDYTPSWDGSLAQALSARRDRDLARGQTTVGPQRDDVEVRLGGMPARTQASQGDQRCLALALRLGEHRRLARLLDDTPVLLLDDVFSELDAYRAAALVECLPAGQVLISATRDVLPPSGRTPSVDVAEVSVDVGPARPGGGPDLP